MFENLTSPACGHETGDNSNPRVAVDVIVDIGGKLLLVRRRNPPYGWALPGGFIEYGESAEDAAARELREETGIQLDNLSQFHVYSDPGRDPRFHVITVVFTASSSDTPAAGDDAGKVGLFDPHDLPVPLVFDHGSIIADYLRLREKSA